MGEVYRARDERLARDVAVKVLPAHFTSDADRLARFEREARALAALNHHSIAAIYGYEEADGIRGLILEPVDGPTLAERIAAEPIAVKEVLTIAEQIADALEAAHAKGIVHRDLKPANIKLSPGGRVKVLDFGLAKTFNEGLSLADVSQADTMPGGATHAGVILGTPAYMSPEQARGKTVDKRTDIWAFGCVLRDADQTHGLWRTHGARRHGRFSDATLIGTRYPRRRRTEFGSFSVVVSKRTRSSDCGTLAMRVWSCMQRSRRLRRRRPRWFRGVRASGSRLVCWPLSLQAYGQESIGSPTLVQLSESEVRRALQDDPRCGRAHSVLGLIYLLQGRLELVRAELDQALKENPTDVTALGWLLHFHRFNGDYVLAREQADRLIRQSPTMWPIYLDRGELLREQGDVPGAVRDQERVLEQDSQNVDALAALARAHADAGDLARARQTLDRARADDRQNYGLRQQRALLLALEGNKREAAQEMDEGLRTYAGMQIFGPASAAEFYAVMGDADTALEWLDRAVRMGDLREEYLRRNPLLTSLGPNRDFGRSSMQWPTAGSSARGSESTNCGGI